MHESIVSALFAGGSEVVSVLRLGMRKSIVV